jgi:hypothetical protein
MEEEEGEEEGKRGLYDDDNKKIFEVYNTQI